MARTVSVVVPYQTKALLMEALQALVLTNTQLQEMLTEAARKGAALAVDELRADLQQSPEEALLQRLRSYLIDPASVPNPREIWAHSGLIRQIEMTARGKPKSTAWFMRFQRESGLSQCHSRPSPGHGRRREWMFGDIKLAWDSYYCRRWPDAANSA